MPDRATPASEWRKPRVEGYLVELPSGHRARIGPVDLSILLLKGDIPDLLTPLATRIIFEGVDEEEMDQQFSIDQVLDRAGETMDFINTICRAAFIEPRIVREDPGEGEILIEDVCIDDRSHVFSIAIHGARVLQSFRVGQEGAVEPPRDSEDEPDEAEQPAGD